jgi:hypothetical protein
MIFGFQSRRLDNGTVRFLSALFALLMLVHPAKAATVTGKADIVDGDTIKVGGIPVRLYAPLRVGKPATETAESMVVAHK